MPDLKSAPAPISEAVTNNIRVEVMSQYSAENSRQVQNAWVFQYTVRITNQGTETVQLISRHWIITDALEHVEEVQGPGVVGETPVSGARRIVPVFLVVPAAHADRNHARNVSNGGAGREAIRYRDRPVRPASAVHSKLAVHDSLPLNFGLLKIDQKTSPEAGGSKVVQTLREVFVAESLDAL